MKYTTVIFDLDGTLLDTLEDLMNSTNYALEKYGYPARTYAEIRAFVGNGIRKLVERALPEGEDTPNFEEIFQSFTEHYMEHCRVKTGPYAGTLELIQKLSEMGVKMAIVSNKNDPAVKELNDYYFSRYIQKAYGVTEHLAKKPAGDMVWHALEELGSTREEAVYVGDSEVDRKTAENSGLDCVLVSWGFRDRELLETLHAKKIINQPMELLEVL